MSTFKTIFALGACACGAAMLGIAGDSAARGKDWTRCVDVYEHRVGNACGSEDSLTIRVRNSCTRPIDAKFCIQKTDRTWVCGMYSEMRPDQSTSFFTCHSTGKVWRWARAADSNERAPSPNN